MLKRFVPTGIVLFLLLAFSLGTEIAGAEMTGWRGNWTGRFPDANPPTEWGKVSTLMDGLRCQAEKPKDDKVSGTSMHHGSPTKWMVLGPLPSEVVDEEFAKGEANLQPKDGEKVKGLEWKEVETTGSVVNFHEIFGTGETSYKPAIAYAHAYIYSPAQAAVRLKCHSGEIYLNGIKVYPVGKKKTAYASITFKEGWNRMLCKVSRQDNAKLTLFSYTANWEIDMGMVAHWPYKTTDKNILWATYLPNWSLASPVIVGGKVFVLSEPGDLICLDKKSGKILWMRSITYYNVATEKEKKENPAFKEVEALLGQLEALNREVIGSGPLDKAKSKERGSVYTKIISAMKRIDNEKYYAKNKHGYCLPTPVSDGKNIYVWLGCGIAACFDLDGNRKWTVSISMTRNIEHGFHSSPALVEGKLIVHRHDLTAFEAATGEVAWQIKKEDLWGTKRSRQSIACYGESPFGLKIQGKEFVYFSGRLFNPADGGKLWEDWKWICSSPTPVVVDDSIYAIARSHFRKSKLPVNSTDKFSLESTNALRLRVTEKGCGPKACGQMRGICASPLYHDGLVYVINVRGYLSVVDAKASRLVYRKLLGLGPAWGALVRKRGVGYCSPVLAGEHIYFFGTGGITVVIEPGRTYKEVARNKIEDITNPYNWSKRPEAFTSTPVPDGNRFYVRGEKYLYCIGEK